MGESCENEGSAKVAPRPASFKGSGGLSLLALAALAGSAAQAAPPAAPADARGSLALYCEAECGEIQLGAFSMRAKLPAAASGKVISVADMSAGPRPSAADLQTWGEGEVAGMSSAAQVVVLSWAAPREQGAAALAEALRIAASAGTWIEDLDTGRYLDRSAAVKVAMEAEASAVDVSKLIVIDVHEATSGLSLLATRGLPRIGLPDLVELGVSPDQRDAAGARLNAIAQAMWEQGAARNGPVSVMDVDASRFTSQPAREAACELKGTATLSYDRGNRALLGSGARALVERFDGGFGSCSGAATAAPTPLSESLASVRARAMVRLKTEIRVAWMAGLPAGERLMVKAPFATPEGSVEWLWINVQSWDADDTLKGTLLSAPTKAVTVKKGDTVQTPLSMVFDWIRVRADGSTEGNETQKWL